MPWHARLQLDYRREHDRTVLHHTHHGPLRVLKSLYPEGPGVCHNVLVHPPAGLVGGDRLDIDVRLQSDTHALISTPGATRFYRSEGQPAQQQVRVHLASGARLEWVPLETIAYPDCIAHNHWSATLAPGAECLGWDVCALGLPSAGQPFERGTLTQHLGIEGLWREEATIDATDTRLLQSPLGLGGQRCMGTLWLACGTPLQRARREALLEAVRASLEEAPPGVQVAATCPNPQVLVVRGLAPLVEPLATVFQRAWATLRAQAWGLPGTPPRVWRV